MAALKLSAKEPEVARSLRLLPQGFLPCGPILQHTGCCFDE